MRSGNTLQNIFRLINFLNILAEVSCKFNNILRLGDLNKDLLRLTKTETKLLDKLLSSNFV